jgi:acyl carrier protein
MESKIKEIMAGVFSMKTSEINEDASPDNIDNWDSLGHMDLITAIEEELDIVFNNDQIIEMMNFRLIVLTVSELKKK